MVALLRGIERGAYVLEDMEHEDLARVTEIVDRYEDVDLVDAVVMAMVERFDEPKLATVDRRHFSKIRPRHRDSIELLPA